MPQKLKLHIHFKKSPKRDNIYKLCLWMLEEHSLLNINILESKRRYDTIFPNEHEPGYLEY